MNVPSVAKLWSCLVEMQVYYAHVTDVDVHSLAAKTAKCTIKHDLLATAVLMPYSQSVVAADSKMAATERHGTASWCFHISSGSIVTTTEMVTACHCCWTNNQPDARSVTVRHQKSGLATATCCRHSHHCCPWCHSTAASPSGADRTFGRRCTTRWRPVTRCSGQ